MTTLFLSTNQRQRFKYHGVISIPVALIHDRQLWTRQCRFPNPKLSIFLEERCNHCPINFLETARCRVLTVGNINSDATGLGISCAMHTLRGYMARVLMFI